MSLNRPWSGRLAHTARTALAIAACVALVAPSLADETTRPQPEPYTWKNVIVGGGGFIPGIVFSRVEPGLAYLRSDMGGAYRWQADEERWIPLQDNFAESSYFGIESIAPDPKDADVVYVAAGMYRGDPAAFMRSEDCGDTWDVFPVEFRMGGNEDGRGVGERLAVDPNDTNILYFGSRHDGLMKSTNRAEMWQKVESFPYRSRGLPEQGPTNTGLSFVIFDPASGSESEPSQTIFVGVADPTDQHLFRSDDAGQSWQPVKGEPADEMLPLQAQITDDGQFLYITYGNGTGPNGVTDGAVWKLDVDSGAWTDITPDKREDRPVGGYTGLSLDRSSPGTLAVATMNRWGPVDTVWRSTDGGETWHDIHTAGSSRDVSAVPFLLWGQPEAKLGWWMSGLAIDPFDSDHVAYTTGATIYATDEFSKVSDNEPTRWKPWVRGIEQTAIIGLMSPPEGPHLFSAFGDIAGFSHLDLDRSPTTQYVNPVFGNTNVLEYAGQAPNVVTRTGTPHDNGAFIAMSTDSGAIWQPVTVPQPNEREPEQRRGGWNPWAYAAALTPSADGKTLLAYVHGQPTMRSTDLGETWQPAAGLPDSTRVIADRVDPGRFYAVNYGTRRFYRSDDGGKTFEPLNVSGMPDLSHNRPWGRESQWPLVATPGHAGDLWIVADGLHHSIDGGQTWQRIEGGVNVQLLALGKSPEGSNFPALFCVGERDGVRAVFRSDDRGQTWLRVNDEQHQWGQRFRCIAADQRVFGRVYVGTDGRGILYGEPSGGYANH